MKKSERGANLLEMAIVTPVLLLLLAGVVDLGRAFYSYIVIANAAREGARVASRLPCYQDSSAQRAALRNEIISAALQEAANSGIQLYPGNVMIDPDPLSRCAGSGNPISVTVSYQHHTWLMSITGIGNFVLSSTTRMVVFGNDQL
jgi:Flp pilus assembly protein TadG